jgi:Helix-hairpin-helix motif
MLNTSSDSAPPSAPPTPPDEWGWTRPQRIGLATLLFLLLALLTIQYLRRPARLTDPIIIHGNPITLPTRIDPNTATAAELTRIPHLGEKLAAKIIDYREARKPLTPDAIVFHTPEDLTHIPGLGPKTLDQLRPYLQFPDDLDTQPTP